MASIIRVMCPYMNTIVGYAGLPAYRAMAILNNVTLGLIRRLDFPFVHSARRFLDANFLVAIHLVC